MHQVIDRGAPIVEDPDRLAGVSAVGVDETAYLRANAQRSTTFATGIADLSAGRSARLLDVVEGRSGTVLAAWLAERDQAWRAGIATASLDPFRGYANAIRDELPDSIAVLDAFHVVKLGSQAVDEVRRRVQQVTLERRGHKDDPLYRIRGLLRRGVFESEAVRGLRQWWSERFVEPDVAALEEPRPRDFDFDELPRGLRTSDVVSRSLETAEALITRFRMAASPPDVLIEFPQDIAATFDFHRASELIARGREKASEALDAAGL